MTKKIQTYAPCREWASDVCQWSSKRTIFGIQKNYHIFSTVSGFRREHFRWNDDEFQGSQCTFSRQNFAKPFLLRHFRTMQVLFTPPGWITWSYQWKKTWWLCTFKHLLVIRWQNIGSSVRKAHFPHCLSDLPTFFHAYQVSQCARKDDKQQQKSTEKVLTDHVS